MQIRHFFDSFVATFHFVGAQNAHSQLSMLRTESALVEGPGTQNHGSCAQCHRY